MAARKAGLGRGLDALLPVEHPAAGFAQIPVDDISPNPQQPRRRFDEEGIDSLASSLREVGMLQPVVVRPTDSERYVLVAGERRWRAASRAGLTEIPALIRQGDDAADLTEALIENIQREDLSPLEEAGAYSQLLEDFGLTHEQIGAQVGKSRSVITNQLRLLQLPGSVQRLLEDGQISAGHARALAAIDDHAYVEHIAARAAIEGWSVRQVEEAAKARRGEPATPRRSAKEQRAPAIIELEQRLSERLGTPVKIDVGRRGGKIIVRYKSLEDLEKIYRGLGG